MVGKCVLCSNNGELKEWPNSGWGPGPAKLCSKCDLKASMVFLVAKLNNMASDHKTKEDKWINWYLWKNGAPMENSNRFSIPDDLYLG